MDSKAKRRKLEGLERKRASIVEREREGGEREGELILVGFTG